MICSVLTVYCVISNWKIDTVQCYDIQLIYMHQGYFSKINPLTTIMDCTENIKLLLRFGNIGNMHGGCLVKLDDSVKMGLYHRYIRIDSLWSSSQ